MGVEVIECIDLVEEISPPTKDIDMDSIQI